MQTRIRELQREPASRSSIDADGDDGLLRLTFECSPTAILVFDKDGTLRLLNPTAERLFNRPSDQIIGQKIRLPIQVGEPKEVDISRPGKDTGIAEIRSNETIWQGETLYVSTLQDVTELVRLREELRALTFVDDLLGLFNRRGFFLLAQQQLKLANRTQKGFYLLFVNLDNLRSVNETSGNQAGDKLLLKAASILKNTFRKSDIIARFGEETFAILAIEAQSGSDDVMTTHLLSSIEKYNAKASPGRKLKVSTGVAYYDPGNPCSIDELIGHADMLLSGHKHGKQKSALLSYIEKNKCSQGFSGGA